MVLVESSGDKDRRTPLYAIETESPGLFTKQLELALINGEIDLAVHSLKDLPTRQPPELRVAAVPKRVESGDCLVIRQDRFTPDEPFGLPPFGLPRGGRVGTSSLRREAQLLSQRPDLAIEAVRGNVPTRVNAAREGKYDAVVLARAGLLRLDQSMEGVVQRDLPDTLFVPAPGQGALAVETRLEIPAPLAKALAAIHDESTARETRIEREILRALEGGCTLPLGVRCRWENERFHLRAFLGLERIRGAKAREWLSFHHFDISEADEATVIEKTVRHFRGVIDGSA
jgi:hydroxymethylbilane synthase